MSNDDLKNAINKLIIETGVELPPQFGSDEHRRVYEAFLARKNKSEADVAPIIERSEIPPEAMAMLFVALNKALSSSDKKEINLTVNMFAMIFLDQNTNVLISRMVYKLLDDMKEDAQIPRDFFAGVYPHWMINAHCILEQHVPLILVSTGFIEMVEASMTTYLSKRNETEKAELLIGFLEDYLKGKLIDVKKADHPSINWGDLSVATFANAVEEFILMHEIGHLALNHLNESAIEPLTLKDGDELQILTREHSKEHEADVWALCKLVERAKKQNDSQFAIELTISGALIFAYIALMLEAICKSRNEPIANTHPPAANRAYVLEVTLELLGFGDLKAYFRKFKRLIREVCVLENVEDLTPPMLAKDLNRVARQVFDNLGMNYDHLPYLLRFV